MAVLIQLIPPPSQRFMDGITQKCPDQLSSAKAWADEDALQFSK